MIRCSSIVSMALMTVIAFSGCTEARLATPATPGSYQSGGGLSPFYAEELHENRLYVFSTKTTWEEFQKSKEISPLSSKRLIGKGPNGMTMVVETSKDEPAKDKRILTNVANRFHLTL